MVVYKGLYVFQGVTGDFRGVSTNLFQNTVKITS